MGALYKLSDGAISEDISITLGKLITKNPCLFLLITKENPHLLIAPGGLVGNLGEEYVDRFKAQKE